MTGKQLDTIVRSLDIIYAELDIKRMPTAILQLLNRVVPCDSAGFHVIDLLRDRVEVVHDHVPEGDRVVPLLDQMIDQHPIANHLKAHWKAGAIRLSDLVTRQFFENTQIGREFFTPLRIRDQIGMFVEERDQVAIGVSAQKDGRGFSDGDRELVTLLQDHLMQAWKNAVHFSSVHLNLNNLEESMASKGTTVISVSRELSIERISSFGVELLAGYFGFDRLSASKLPDAVTRWLKHCTGTARFGPEAANRVPRTVAGARGTLTINWMPASNGYWLLLCETSKTDPISRLIQLGFTKKEAGVLVWMMKGKTNAEIARRVKCSINTVRKHVEHILMKLGVESRSAAANSAHELISKQ